MRNNLRNKNATTLQAKSLGLDVLRDSFLDGLIALGSDFIFVKLNRDEVGPKYLISDQFEMRRSGDLYQVFRILK